MEIQMRVWLVFSTLSNENWWASSLLNPWKATCFRSDWELRRGKPGDSHQHKERSFLPIGMTQPCAMINFPCCFCAARPMAGLAFLPWKGTWELSPLPAGSALSPASKILGRGPRAEAKSMQMMPCDVAGAQKHSVGTRLLRVLAVRAPTAVSWRGSWGGCDFPSRKGHWGEHIAELQNRQVSVPLLLPFFKKLGQVFFIFF